MKKRMFVAIILMLAIVMLCACGRTTPTKTASNGSNQETPAVTGTEQGLDEDNPIYIGMTVPMTGPAKEHGDKMIISVNMAVDRINDEGGVLDRPLKILFEDEGEAQQDSINSMMKLLSNKDLVAIIGSVNSPFCIATSDLVAQEGITCIYGGSSVSIVEQGIDWIWLMRTLDSFNGPNMVKLAVDVNGCSKIAVIHMTDASGTSYSEAIVNALKNNYNIDPVIRLGFDEETETNYNPYIIQAMDAGAECIIVSAGTNAGPLIQIAAKNNGYEGVCLGTSQLVSAKCLESAKEASNGWQSISDYSSAVTDTEYQKWFVEEFTNKVGLAPDFFDAEYHDIVLLLAKAIEVAGSTDRAAINEALKEIKDLQGVMTTYSYHDNHSFANTIYVVEVVDKVPVVKDRIDNY